MILQTESLTEPGIEFEAPDFTSSMYFESAAERPMESSRAVRFKCSVCQALPQGFPPDRRHRFELYAEFLPKLSTICLANDTASPV